MPKPAPKKKTNKLQDLFEKFPTVVTLDSRHRPVWEKPTKKFVDAYKKDCGFEPVPSMFFPVCIPWSEKGRGFGSYTFFLKGNEVWCDNECDSRDTVKRILCTLVDQAKFADETPKARAQQAKMDKAHAREMKKAKKKEKKK